MSREDFERYFSARTRYTVNTDNSKGSCSSATFVTIASLSGRSLSPLSTMRCPERWPPHPCPTFRLFW